VVAWVMLPKRPNKMTHPIPETVTPEVLEIIERNGGVAVNSSQSRLKDFLLEMYRSGDLEAVFDRSAVLTVFGEEKYARSLTDYSDQELQDELSDRGIVDIRDIISQIQYRKRIGLDIQDDVAKLLGFPLHE